MTSALWLWGLLAVTRPVLPGASFPAPHAITVHLGAGLESVDPDDDVHPRTGQPPLTNDDVTSLARSGLPPPVVVHLLEERRCACDVSPAALLRWKRDSVDASIIAAASLHALPPNRALELDLDIDLPWRAGAAPRGTLVVFIDDATASRSLAVPLSALVDGTAPARVLRDTSDPLLTRTVRRVRLRGTLPLVTAGRRTLLVAVTRGTERQHPSQLAPDERAAARLHTFVYPRASTEARCTLRLTMEHDAVLDDAVTLRGSALQCAFGD